ncbi:hypothetical protein UlMin_026161 [Ulmus minor]
MNLVGAKFEPIKSALYSFTGDSVSSEGVLNLPIELGTHPCQHIQSVNFVVMDCPSSYNAIIGRPTLNAIRAVTSTYHLLFDELDPREPAMEQHGEPVEELEEIPLFENDLTKTCKIGSSLTGQLRTDFINFLRDHRDVFAWSHEDMPGIDPKVIVHHLNIDPSFRPVKQKRRTFNAERYMAINTEANGNWRVCVDFTDLNKACPKDIFPLPRIDQLVDATVGHELLSFMDAYSGYNQIRMHQPDQNILLFSQIKGFIATK